MIKTHNNLLLITPLAKTQQDYKALLPHYIDKEELKSFKQSNGLFFELASNSKVG